MPASNSDFKQYEVLQNMFYVFYTKALGFTLGLYYHQTHLDLRLHHRYLLHSFQKALLLRNICHCTTTLLMLARFIIMAFKFHCDAPDKHPRRRVWLATSWSSQKATLFSRSLPKTFIDFMKQDIGLIQLQLSFDTSTKV